MRFEIRDTGVGIGPDAIDRVFAPFEQADSLTWSKFGGTGLGLAICKKLALMMGGDVVVESAPGEGSVFWLQVDLESQDAVEASEPEPASAPVSIPEVSSSACRDILVAEDDPDMAVLIEDLLTDAGYRATVVPDGASVLNALGERRFDVVLMDGRMPDMSGFETTDRIRRFADDRAQIPIVALTAEAMAGDRERFLAAGMDDYVSKPIDYDTLIKTIERCCREGRRRAAPTPEAAIAR
jgi:CheY-like chemotaxis protein